MKLKRLLAGFCCAALALGAFTGCQQSGGSSDGSYNVAIVQLVDNGAFTEMREAFIQQMRDLGYTEDEMTFDVLNAQGDTSTLNSICADLNNRDYDLIVPIVTPATQAVVNAEPDAPVVFISVTNPVNAGVMSSMEAPDKNATGTSNIVPVDEIFGLMNTLTPDAKNIGILYCSGEVNAVSTAQNAKDYLTENGYTYDEVTVTNSSEVQQAAQSLASRVDAIYVPIDSTVQTSMAQVVEAATDNGIAVYGSDPVMVQSGALASASCSNTQLGQESAKMADQILQGTPVSDVPAIYMSDFQYVVNQDTANALGITLPADQGWSVISTEAQG